MASNLTDFFIAAYHKRNRWTLPVIIFLVLVSVGCNSIEAGPPRRLPPGPPPREALDACRDYNEKETCQFTHRNHEIHGICLSVPGSQMACVPDEIVSGHGRPANSIKSSPVDIKKNFPGAIDVFSRIPDTGQGSCFDNEKEIPCPEPGEDFFGQDAHYLGAPLSYTDQGDGTILDSVTGLVWQKGHNEKRLTWIDADRACKKLVLGNKSDWRLPDIKELYSLANFRGSTGRRPYIDSIFEIQEPNEKTLKDDDFASTHFTSMMGQTWSSTIYTADHMGKRGMIAAFFFNFLDGRIKQAPIEHRPELFYRCVRGTPHYKNKFSILSVSSVEDKNSGLIWQRRDSQKRYDWKGALNYCENLNLDGNSDWRLPNARELQSIVDYEKHDPALDRKIFPMTDTKAWYWSSTTHGDEISNAVYVCMGRCSSTTGVDYHGSGAQRSDPKTGDPSRYSMGRGGQNDEVRIFNYAKCVRSPGLPHEQS